VGGFWNRIAGDKKLNKLLLEKFPMPKPEVLNLFGCQPWINISPDTFQMFLNEVGQDSTLRDSLLEVYTNRLKPGETPGGEAPADKEGDPEQPKDKPEGEKKDNLINRLFRHRGSDKEEAKRGGGGN
jgi:hypothetical protein